MTDLSIVVLNYNTRNALRTCLQSIRAEGSTTLSSADAPIDAELIVVDNDSPDDSAAMVDREFPWARLIRSPRNGGFANGNNQALREVSGQKAVLLLNPDTEVPSGAFAGLLARLDEHPEAGVIGPKLLKADGEMHLACRRSFPSPEVSFFRLSGLSRKYPKSAVFGRYNLSYLDSNEAAEVDSVCGACMLVRREALDESGLLDESFFMYGEDLDWCWRIREAGWTVRYEPSVTVRHQHGAAGRTRPFRTTIAFFRAMDLFYRKHYRRRYNPLVTSLVVSAIYGGMFATLLRRLLNPDAARPAGH